MVSSYHRHVCLRNCNVQPLVILLSAILSVMDDHLLGAGGVDLAGILGLVVQVDLDSLRPLNAELLQSIWGILEWTNVLQFFNVDSHFLAVDYLNTCHDILDTQLDALAVLKHDTLDLSFNND